MCKCHQRTTMSDTTESQQSDVIDGIVCYTDGGARPNPGPTGYGMHGYFYAAKNPKKGLGNGMVATNRGYLENKGDYNTIIDPNVSPESFLALAARSSRASAVTVIGYFDEVGSIGVATNNVGELAGVIRAMEFGLQKKVRNIYILTDSDYVRKAANGWVDRWVQTGWKRPDGTDIQNVVEWKKFLTIRSKLEEAKIELTIERVPGHEGFLGNEEADTLATIAVFRSQNGDFGVVTRESPADGYWKRDNSRHAFLSNRYCYFNTLTGVTIPGHYLLGNQDDEFVGTPDSEGHYAVVRLDTPDTMIESIRGLQAGFSGGADSLYMAYLENLFNPTIYDRLNTYGKLALIPPSGYRLNLKYIDDTPITRELKPAKKAMDAVNALTRLDTLLQMFAMNDPELVVTDITPVLYEVTRKVTKAKKGEAADTVTTSMKLKSDMVVGMAKLDVKVKHPFSKDDGDLMDITLSTGVDILDRNSLKRLEELNPQICVIAWKESPMVFRFATVIRAGNSLGIWASVNSNLRIYTPPVSST